MAKAPSLLDEVCSRLPRKGQAPWYKTLRPDLLAEIDSIKAAWREGRLPAHTTKTGLAAAIAASLQARGVEIGPFGVSRWLATK
jgi:hypothetical protein